MQKELENLYSAKYVQTQLDKFRNRRSNHWANHIRLAKMLVKNWGAPPPAYLLDLGCSIGTFALEFALEGYDTFGLDFDTKALREAQKLAQELDCDNSKWICADAGKFSLKREFDIIVCFDLIEHLEDNVMSNMLNCVWDNLKRSGIFVFHTFPTKYDYIFFRDNTKSWPLIPFRNLPNKLFEKMVKLYAIILDAYFLISHGKRHKKCIANTVHPNPLTEEKLKDFLQQTGFQCVMLEKELDAINPLKPGQGILAKKYFSHQPVVKRSVYGVARKTK